jgi:hypothetical protein
MRTNRVAVVSFTSGPDNQSFAERRNAFLAQLDRAPRFERGCLGFESSRVLQFPPPPFVSENPDTVNGTKGLHVGVSRIDGQA